jgi:hypothetical protein
MFPTPSKSHRIAATRRPGTREVAGDPRYELDHRANDGIDVWLLWCPRDDRVLVAVADEKTGERFEIEVREGEPALDVFHHPYAYAAWRGVDARPELPEAMSWSA